MGKKLVIVVASWEGNWEARGGSLTFALHPSEYFRVHARTRQKSGRIRSARACPCERV